MALAALLAAVVGGAAAGEAETPLAPSAAGPLRVEVLEFRLLPVDARDFVGEDVANPLEEAPPPLLDPAELDRLPPEDRLPVLLKEQEVRREWQEKKREIDLQRYNERLAAESQARDAMRTDEGRAVLQGAGIMEAALGAWPDVFELVRGPARGGEGAAAECQVEGTVGDLTVRTVSQARGVSTVQAAVYRLPVTIQLRETGSGRTLGVYSEEVVLRDVAEGRSPMSRQEAVQALLRQAAKAAAERFAAVCPPAARAAATEAR